MADEDQTATKHMDIAFAVLAEQVRALSIQQGKMEAQLNSISAQVSEATNRWKGGLAVVLAAGGLIGWFISTWKGIH